MVNGFFADWMVEMAQRAGARVTVLNVAWEQVLSGETLRRALDEARQASQLYTLVTAVHSETSTGQLNPVGELGAICREFDTLLLADAISSLGCAPLSMARDNIDLCVTASQKGLCAPLGLSAVAVGERALAVMARKGPAQSYVLDLARWQKFFAAPVPRPYPIVPSPHLVLALHASLQQIHAEGLSQRFKRHQQIAAATRSGLMALGLDCFAAVPSPSVTAFKIPAGLTGSDIIQRMVKEHNVQVAGGMGELAGRLIRISHIGRQATPELQLRTLQAVAAVLKGLGHPCDSLHAERTFRSTYQA